MRLPKYSGKPRRRKLLIVRRVVGASMEPALKPGQVVLASGVVKAKAGKIVVLRHQGIEKIKRVKTIENNSVFVVGDNAASSTDSRHFGLLPTEAIVGTVVWPRRRTIK